MKWDGACDESIRWWVFIYPVAAHGPCSHVCVPKKQKWHHLPDNFPRPQQQHQQCRVITLSTPTTTQTNEHNAGIPNDTSPSVGRVFCFIHLLLFLLNVFYFVLGSIL
jgi:hypothetical protein